MRLNVFALPALLALLLSINNLIGQLPWAEAHIKHESSQRIAKNIDVQKPEIVQETRTIALGKGQTIGGMLAELNIEDSASQEITNALADVYKIRELRAGQEFNVNLEHSGEASRITQIAFTPDPLQRIVIKPDAMNLYSAEKIVRQTEKRTVAVKGDINGAFILSARKAGVPNSVAAQMTRWMAYDIDFQRDIHKGDQFQVMFDAQYDDQGNIIKAEDIHYIQLNGKRENIRLYRFDSRMYHADGRDVRRTLLKTPVDGARMSSGFGMRRHPVLGYNKMHRGVDFAAPSGTPIYAAGDGVVQKASWFSSYGKYVRIKHGSNYSTAYAHLSRFAKGIRPGSKVSQGQVIGYVGSTGRSTGPHLHFEVLKGNSQVNPKSVASLNPSKLGGKQLASFKNKVAGYDQQFAQLIGRQAPKLAQNNIRNVE